MTVRTQPLRPIPIRLFPSLALALLTACGGHSIDFPSDSEITGALRANFEESADNAGARALVAQLGGDKGRLDYGVRRVIWRQGAFEAHYDVQLRMGRAGTDSLQAMYAEMIPPAQRQPLGKATRDSALQWLRQHADSLEASAPAEAQRLRATLERMERCYADAAAGAAVPLMRGLRALLSPTRDGWYAERLQSAEMELQCLPL